MITVEDRDGGGKNCDRVSVKGLGINILEMPHFRICLPTLIKLKIMSTSLGCLKEMSSSGPLLTTIGRGGSQELFQLTEASPPCLYVRGPPANRKV